MMLTVTTLARSPLFSTVAKLKAELGITGNSQDDILLDMLRGVSDKIVTLCNRPFAREVYTETLGGPGGEIPGKGTALLMLKRTPIVSVASVFLDGEAITDYSIEDAVAGFLYREIGWASTRLIGWVLTGYDRPGFIPPRYTVNYTAGYLMPADDMAATTLSASSTDNSYNDSASGFPNLAEGDVVTVAGFTTAGNNGQATVVSRTASKLVVSGLTLTTEAAGDSVTVVCRTLPYDLERAAIETAKAWYRAMTRDPALTSKTVGPTSLSYAPGAFGEFPPRALAILDDWQRAA